MRKTYHLRCTCGCNEPFTADKPFRKFKNPTHREAYRRTQSRKPQGRVHQQTCGIPANVGTFRSGVVV